MIDPWSAAAVPTRVGGTRHGQRIRGQERLVVAERHYQRRAGTRTDHTLGLVLGNHDNRVYEDDWAEKWQGLLTRNQDGTTNYDNQANQNIAKNLKGKLLLAHGTLDSNVPPYSTLLVVNELIKANKDFDLILFPNRPHGFGNEPYMVRRRWDYFVRHLLGAEPPREFELHPPAQTGPLGFGN